MAAARGEGTMPGHVGIRAEELDLRGPVVVQRGEVLHPVDTFHLSGFEIRDGLRPQVFGLPAHDSVAILQSFLWTIGGVDPAEHHGLPAFAKFRGELVRAWGVAGHHGDADQVAGLVEVDSLDRLIHELDVPRGRRVRGDHRQAEFGEPDGAPLARSHAIRIVPGVGIEEK